MNYAKALIEAAFRPKIFRAMREADCHNMTEHERREWLRGRAFSVTGAANCSRTYMETVVFIVLDLGEELKAATWDAVDVGASDREAADG